MPRSLLLVWVSVVCVGALIVDIAHAAVQRMGIPAGVYTLGAGATRDVKAFCFDFTRHSPSASSTFAHVLTASANATVTIGTHTMTLQRAITQHKLEVRGLQLTISALMAQLRDPAYLRSLSPSTDWRDFEMLAQIWPQLSLKQKSSIVNSASTDWRDLEMLAQIWPRLSLKQKSSIVNRLAPKMANIGSYSQLEIVNLTNAPISLDFRNTTVLGVHSEPSPGSVANFASESGSHIEIQRRIWNAVNQRDQALLRIAGFLDEQPTRKMAGSTKTAIIAFQDSFGLPGTGQIDAATAAKLEAFAQNQAYLRTINETDGQAFLAATLQLQRHSAHTPMYRLSFGGGKVVYGDSYNALYKKLMQMKSTHQNHIEHIYVIPEGFSKDREAAATVSFKQADRANNEALNVKIVTKSAEMLMADPLFGKQILKIVDDGAPSAPASFNGSVGFRQLLKIDYTDGSSIVLHITAATRELLQKFVENLKATLRVLQATVASSKPHQLLKLTAAEIVNVALWKTAHDLNLSSAQLREKLRAELGKTEIAWAFVNRIASQVDLIRQSTIG